jgi:hypothetical protein
MLSQSVGTLLQILLLWWNFSASPWACAFFCAVARGLGAARGRFQIPVREALLRCSELPPLPFPSRSSSSCLPGVRERSPQAVRHRGVCYTAACFSVVSSSSESRSPRVSSNPFPPIKFMRPQKNASAKTRELDCGQGRERRAHETLAPDACERRARNGALCLESPTHEDPRISGEGNPP